MKTKISTIFAFIIFISGLASSNLAQTPESTPPPPPPTESEDVITVSSRLVVVPVSVTDQNGLPVKGLQPADFRLKEEGRPQEIDSISPAENVPLDIVLLFDVSASTDSMFKFQQETAAKFLTKLMRQEDRASVYTIGAKPIVLVERESSQKAVDAVMTIKPTKEFTAFFDSISLAANKLKNEAPKGTRRVILVVSDGEDTNSTRIAKAIQDGYAKADVNSLDMKELYALTVANRNSANMKERVHVLKFLQDADSVFYSINPAGSSLKLNKMSEFGQANMQKFADDTGGTAFLPKFLPIDTKDDLANIGNQRKNTAMLERIFTQLENELRAQYLVQFYSEAEFPDNRFVKLNVELANKGSNQIRARQGYYVKN